MDAKSRLEFHVFDSWEGHTFEAYSNACSKCRLQFRDWIRTRLQCAGQAADGREIQVEIGGARD